MKIVYFTSEFPGQTHVFLWREYEELLCLGVDVELISTRSPVKGFKPRGWNLVAAQRTRYLYPLTSGDVAQAVSTLLGCSPGAWAKVLSVIFRTPGLSLQDRFALFVHLVLATKLVRIMKASDCAHVHCTTCAATANIAMFSRFISGVTYSLSLLGPRLETYGSNQANKWRHASFALFQSQKLMRETHEAIGASVPRLHAFAPVGVNTDTVRRSGAYVPWTRGTDCVLYSCGRLHPIKGHEYVIQAAG